MKVALLALVLLCSIGLSQQLTAQQVIQAVNKARTNPVYYANLINSQYTSKNIKGTSNDPNCYTEAETFLRAKVPLTAYTESIVADLAAWRHSKWMKETGTFSHTGLSGSNPKTRLDWVGTWPTAAYGYNENIAWFSAGATAEAYVVLWIADCGIASRGHRNNIYSTTVQQYGCADFSYYATCVGTQPINLQAAITDADLTAAGLSKAVNGVGYKGV